MKRSNKKQNGQSLVEIMAALALLVIVILALTRVATVTLRNASFAKNRSLATKYSQEVMEMVRGHHGQNNWPTFVADCNSGSISFTAPPTPFTLSPLDCHLLCVSPPCTDPCTDGDSDVCEVIVEVVWQEGPVSHQSKLTSQFTSQ